MRAKGQIIAVCIIIVLVGVCLIEFNNKSSVVVKAPLYDVAKQVNDLNNWKKWDTIFNTSGNTIPGGFGSNQTLVTSNGTYTLQHISPVALSLTKNTNGHEATTCISTAPLTDSTTVITTEEKTSVFNYITKGSAVNDGTNMIAAFKTWMEDATNKYGFPIQLVPVKDTLILTTKATITNSANATANLYNLLYSFIQQHGLPFEKSYFYKTVLNDKEIAVGIPVYKAVKDTGTIHCLQLPRNGRLIEGKYSGDISSIEAIYKAAANFMMDKHLKQVAQPLEQYNITDTTILPGGTVKIIVFYPIF